jgi:hypothetical protein
MTTGRIVAGSRARIAAVVLAAAVLAGPAAAAARTSSDFAIKVGAQLEFEPALAQAFSLDFQSEYRFGGPVWFAFGTGFAVNDKAFDWNLQVGVEGKFPSGNLTPTVRFAMWFDWKNTFDPQNNLTSFPILGAIFGPGLRYELGEGRGILFELNLAVGRHMRDWEPGERPLYLAFIPQVGFQF